MKEQLENQLVNACEYYCILDEFDEEIAKRETQLNEKKKLLKKNYDGIKRRATFKGGRFGIIVGCVVPGFILTAVLASLSETIYGNEEMMGTIMMLGMHVCIPVALVLSLIIYGKTYCARKTKEINARADQYLADAEPEVKEEEELLKKLTEEREQFASMNENCLAFLPNTYREPLAVAVMMEAFHNGRGETMKELMNIYEEQVHRWKLEAQTEMQTEVLRRQLSDISYQQRRAANTLQGIHALQIYNTLRK